MIEINIIVSKDKIEKYPPILQSGIILQCEAGQSVGTFLANLPGFDMDYIVNKIQTVFLDGNAIDDMETQLNNSPSVLALSAAMPGLAGAIFRRNSLHAALRTPDSNNNVTTQVESTIAVRLKLFNTIASDKGQGILEKGGVFSGSVLINFFQQRLQLKQSLISIETIDGYINTDVFLSFLQPSEKYIVTISFQ